MRVFGIVAACVAGLGLAQKAAACSVALALTIDVSGSVDTREYQIQRDGLAEALSDSVVSEALVRALAMVVRAVLPQRATERLFTEQYHLTQALGLDG